MGGRTAEREPQHSPRESLKCPSSLAYCSASCPCHQSCRVYSHYERTEWTCHTWQCLEAVGGRTTEREPQHSPRESLKCPSSLAYCSASCPCHQSCRVYSHYERTEWTCHAWQCLEAVGGRTTEREPQHSPRESLKCPELPRLLQRVLPLPPGL